MEECTHGVYTWNSGNMEEYTHRVVYTWRSVYVEEYTHKETKHRKIHIGKSTHKGEYTRGRMNAGEEE